MLPNYLVIGAQKSATSSLCALLGQHPDVFMCDPKEPYFFSHDEIYARGLGWYESLFDVATGAAAVGEGSTTYTQRGLYPNAATRVIEHLPRARLIFMARHPIERIRSHWMHLKTKGGRETLPISEAVRERPEYIDHSLYETQLAPYRAHYGDRLLTLCFEEFQSDPEGVTRRCFEFLEVDPSAWRPEDADRARHRSSEGRADRGAMRALRRVPGFSALRDAAPTGLRESLRQVFKKPVGDKPEFDEETRGWLADRLRDEARLYLERAGKPADYWSL